MKLHDIFSDNFIPLPVLFVAVASIILIFMFFLKIYVTFEIFIASIVALLCCVFWLIVKKHNIKYSSKLKITKTTHYITNIFFIFLYVFSILLIYTSGDSYQRPIGFFVIWSIMVSIIFFEIFLPVKEKFWTWITFLKIIFVVLLANYSENLIFPSLLGIDPWFHQLFAQELISSGHIPNLISLYDKIPIYPLIISSTSILANENFKLSTLLSVMILNTIILILFIYLIVNSLLKDKIGTETSKKLGLIAGLFILIGALNFNFYSVHLVPFVFAFNYILIIVYLLLNLDRLKSFYIQIIIIIELCALILCHPFPTLLMEFILFINVILLVISKKLNLSQFQDDLKQKLFIYFFVLFTIGTLIYWLDFTNLSESILRLFDTNFGTYTFRDLGTYNNVSHIPMKPFFDQLCDMFILDVYYGLSLLGIFFLLSEKIRDKKIFILLSSSALAFCIGLVGYFLISELNQKDGFFIFNYCFPFLQHLGYSYFS